MFESVSRWVVVSSLVVTSFGVLTGSIFAANPEAGSDTTGVYSSVPEGVAEPEQIETFTPPTPSKSEFVKAPKASVGDRRHGWEGWVELSMMVDPEGKAYDVTVVDSSGNPKLEKSVIAQSKSWKFEPAVLNGVPIDAAYSFNMVYYLPNLGAGANRSFVRRFRKVIKAIENGQRAKADKGLTQLDASRRNLYEHAFSHLAHFEYEQKWGAAEASYKALAQAAFLDGRKGFLPDDVLSRVLVNKLNLELGFSRYVQAGRTAEAVLKREIDPGTRSEIETVVAQIETIAQSDSPVVVSGEISDSNQYAHRLLRSSFSFQEVEGDIAELRLHCPQGYYGYIHKPDTVYNIEPADQRCKLIAIGTPGTTFKLLELQGAR